MFLPVLAVLVALGAAGAAGTAAAATGNAAAISLSKEEQRDEALRWMRETGKGTKAALSTGRWPALRQGYLDYASKRAKLQTARRFQDDTRNAGNRLLTATEDMIIRS